MSVMSVIDIVTPIGKTYGMWAVKKFHSYRSYSNGRAAIFECICKECGAIKNKFMWDLSRVERGKLVGTCGCARIKKAIRNFKKQGPRSIISKYKYHAKQRNYCFELTDEQAIKIIESMCHYCGKQPSNTAWSTNKHASYVYNGIDRIDNNFGYIDSNCVSCCYQCNRCKSDLTYDEFIEWVRKVNTHLACKSCEA